MDFTSTGVAVPHTDPEKDDLPASPVLLVATVDGVLRFYTFSHTDRASGRLVQPPRSVPPTAPELLASGVSFLSLSTSMTVQVGLSGPLPPLLVRCPEGMLMVSRGAADTAAGCHGCTLTTSCSPGCKAGFIGVKLTHIPTCPVPKGVWLRLFHDHFLRAQWCSPSKSGEFLP